MNFSQQIFGPESKIILALTLTKQSWKWMRKTPGALALLLLNDELTAEVIVLSAFGQLVL